MVDLRGNKPVYGGYLGISNGKKRGSYRERYLFARDTAHYINKEGGDCELLDYFMKQGVFIESIEDNHKKEVRLITHMAGATIIIKIDDYVWLNNSEFLDTDGSVLVRIIGNDNLDDIVDKIHNDLPFLKPLRKDWQFCTDAFTKLMSKDIGYEQEYQKGLEKSQENR